MAGGATSFPKTLIDGKRPFHLYPPAREYVPKVVLELLKAPLLPTAFAAVCWPVYTALATHFQSKGWGEAEFLTLCFCSMIAGTYVLFNGFFAFIEHQRWFERYKIDRRPHQLGSWKQAGAALKEVAVGRLLLAPLGIYLIGTRFLWAGGILQRTFDLSRPSLLEVYVAFLAGSIFNSVVFYCVHRSMHSSSLYAKFHKQHHEWKGTVSLSAEYAHPVEQLFANYIPTLGGCLLVGAHPWVFCVWVCERLRETYEGHSGYAFNVHPVLDFLNITNHTGTAEHDFHHTCNSGNFGPQWMDWLCGTMDAWAVAGCEEEYLNAKEEEKLSYMRKCEK